MRIKVGNFTIAGASIAGRYTSICIPELKVCFDMGCLPDSSTGAHTVLVSHGHTDHIGCLNLHLRQRILKHIKIPPNYIMPRVCHEPYKVLYSAFSALDRGHPDTILYTRMINFKLLAADDFQSNRPPFKLNQNYVVHSYPMTHRVPTYGYTIFENRLKLKPEFRELPGKEIARLRASPDFKEEELFFRFNKPIISYSGDTTFEAILEHAEIFFNSQVLILECTFLQDFTVEEARKRGHVQITEILDHKDLIKCEHLVLCHFSSRYFDHHEENNHFKELISELDFVNQMKPVQVHFLDELLL